MSVRLLVFLHGTVLMHPDGVGRTRAERVAQSRDRMHPGLYDFAAYVPVDGAVAKLWRWVEDGAEIAYLSSHRDPYHLAEDASVLRRWDFPRGRVVARRPGEDYGDVAERVLPDVVIEDDCESLGPGAAITSGQIRPELRSRIASIVVPEFGGIDHLPDLPQALLAYAAERRSRRRPAASPRWARELARRD
jgi:hypothetical protein